MKPKTVGDSGKGIVHGIVATVGAALPAAIGLLLAFRLITGYLNRHPGGDFLDRLAFAWFSAMAIGLLVEVTGAVAIFRRLPK